MSKIYQPRHNLVVNRSGVGNVATAYTDAFASDAFGRPESPGVLLLIKLTCGNPTNLTSFDIRVIGRQISQDSSDILGVLPAAGQPGILLPTFDAEGTSNPPTLATTVNIAAPSAGASKWVARRIPEHLAYGWGAFIFQHKGNGGAVQAGDGVQVLAVY